MISFSFIVAGVVLVHDFPSMNPGGAVAVLGAGFVLGIRHALDADHLLAISTMVSDRNTLSSSSLVGVLWGLGHTASILAVGGLVILLGVRIPEQVGLLLELGVGLMLVVLGVKVLVRVARGSILHIHTHRHGEHRHIHPHLHPHNVEGDTHTHHRLPPSSLTAAALRHLKSGWRSILVGMIHGLAGSAALMLLILASISSRSLALLYLAVFGAGSIGGMLLMSVLVSLPLTLTARHMQRMNVLITGCAGAASMGFGLFLAWQIVMESGLSW